LQEELIPWGSNVMPEPLKRIIANSKEPEGGDEGEAEATAGIPVDPEEWPLPDRLPSDEDVPPPEEDNPFMEYHPYRGDDG
jgi:hypothetical protein